MLLPGGRTTVLVAVVGTLVAVGGMVLLAGWVRPILARDDPLTLAAVVGFTVVAGLLIWMTALLWIAAGRAMAQRRP